MNPPIGKLLPKDCIFRIYRDVRFSKNKAPYKAHFSASINEGGKNQIYRASIFTSNPEANGEIL
ncbi:MAG: DUF2461 family protein [Bacteroidetes bacterium]|nr:DUF2461 family protein [Bacteroidota bacterium]